MERFLKTVLVLPAVLGGGLAIGQAGFAQVGQLAAASNSSVLNSSGSVLSGSNSSVRSGSSAGNLADVPPLPPGKSTILGGQIRNIDQVRDQFVLHVYGEKPLKVLYDERTKIFRDGNRIPLLELSPAEHASVQTTLDGSKVFAISVHILSQTPKGAFEGRIESYEPGSGMLTLVGAGSQGLFRVRISQDTAVSREGQTAFTAKSRGQFDLVPGALVSLTFQSDSKGQGTAQQITILATPGASFVFVGTVTALNVAGGYLVVLDLGDERSYQIHFSSQDPVVEKLHQGDRVRIGADYNGTRYEATEIGKL
jgi:hypothetical protein